MQEDQHRAQAQAQAQVFLVTQHLQRAVLVVGYLTDLLLEQHSLLFLVQVQRPLEGQIRYQLPHPVVYLAALNHQAEIRQHLLRVGFLPLQILQPLEILWKQNHLGLPRQAPQAVISLEINLKQVLLIYSANQISLMLPHLVLILLNQVCSERHQEVLQLATTKGYLQD